MSGDELVLSSLPLLRERLARRDDAGLGLLPDEDSARRLVDRIDAVLSGRSPLSGLTADPAFQALATAGMEQVREVWQDMPRAERDRLVTGP